MTNSQLFKQAHKMTKLTIQPNETYRYKFGQWLIFLKTGITNMIKPIDKKVNQSVCYVPILNHDKDDKFSYSESFIFNILKFIFTSPLSLFIIFMITMFIVL